jgi:branched-chain amino acid transport system substrate-binding protein
MIEALGSPRLNETYAFRRIFGELSFSVRVWLVRMCFFAPCAPGTSRLREEQDMLRRDFLTSGAALAAGVAFVPPATADETPGVTATEIKIGNTMPYSGPAASYGVIGRTEAAFLKMINDQGGIAGRKLAFISLDDGYSPPKTVEQTRKLVEDTEVALLFGGAGTAPNTAVQKYLNDRGVPQIFVASGADKWGNYSKFPYTIGWSPSYRTEAQIYAKYILAHKPHARIGILYQNDDFGKDYLLGFRDVLDDKFDRMVAKSVSYEPTDATIDSQIDSLQSAEADTFMLAAGAKAAAQGIRRSYDVGWKPLFFMSNTTSSVGMVINPTGPEKAVGIITTGYLKDPTDPTWNDDPGMKDWRAFMTKYMPEGDPTDNAYLYAYDVSLTLVQVLKQCGNDFSRANIMRQAANLHDFEIPTLLPGIKVNTSKTNYHPIRQMQLTRWNGKTWERFGELIEGSGAA